MSREEPARPPVLPEGDKEPLRKLLTFVGQCARQVTKPLQFPAEPFVDSYLERRAAVNNHQVTATTPESSALYQLTLGEDLSFQLQRESATWFPLFSTIRSLCQCQWCDEALIRQLPQSCSQSRRQKIVVKVVSSFLQFLTVQDVKTTLTCVIFSHTDSVCILADLKLK